MNVVGDLERLFASSLYPLRVPIAIGLIFGLVALVALARQRGWLAAARRHPGRTAAVSIVAIAVALPAAWYLGSPLFIRTQLVEPDPVAVAASTTRPPIPPASDAPSMASAPVATSAGPTRAPTPIATPFAPRIASVGAFQGADDFHFGEGTASIIETAPGVFALRFEAFSVRNGPDLYVYLSPDATGYTDAAVELGTLKATDGAFGYELPAGLDPSDFASAVIWCKQFSVQFAVAPLEVA